MKAPTIIVTRGHVAEGTWTGDPSDRSKWTFDGELICGPHDGEGGHVEPCSQCGGSFAGHACGPSHAIVAQGRSYLLPASTAGSDQ